MSLGPTLETARLILRPPTPEDFEGWAAFAADEEINRFLGGAQPREVAWRMMCTMTGAWVVRGFSMFSIIEKESGRWVGRLGPWQPEGWPGTEVGYAFHQDAHGRGYGTEACVAAIDWAFDTLGWTEVIHCISPENFASQNVAKRLGSRNLGPARLPPPLDAHAIDLWGQTREEWRARRAGASA